MQGQGCARCERRSGCRYCVTKELRLHSLCICDLELTPAVEAGPGSVKQKNAAAR